MLFNLLRDNISARLWDILIQFIGDPPYLYHARTELTKLRQEVDEQRKINETIQANTAIIENKLTQTNKDLEKTRYERLEWMARESVVRKEIT